MVTRLLQATKAESPMVITDAGKVILVRLSQPKKADWPIVARELFAAKVIVVTFQQFAKACCPMVVTEAGILMLVRFIQFEKAPSPIVITEPGMLKEPAFAPGKLINSD